MQSTSDNLRKFTIKVEEQLTRVQKRVLHLFLSNQDDEMIADYLEIADSTVRQHISRIANKLEIPSDKTDKGFRRRELVSLFRRFEIKGYAVADIHYCDESVFLEGKSSALTVEPKQAWQSDPNFVGREEAINTLNNFREQGVQLLQIVGVSGQGKSTLARKYLNNNFPQVIEFEVKRDFVNIITIEASLNEKLYQLGEEIGEEFSISLDRLKSTIQSKPIGILVDDFEQVLDSKGRLASRSYEYIELLKVLGSENVQSFTIIASREFITEPEVSSYRYKLEALGLDAWKIYFKQREVEVQDDLLQHIYNSCFGIAKAMEIFAAKEKPLEIYWQTIFNDPFTYEPDLNHLALDSISEISKKNPKLISLIKNHGKDLSLEMAKNTFSHEEKELWLQIERYSLGQWSHTKSEFQIHEFLYEKIVELAEFERQSADPLTGENPQCSQPCVNSNQNHLLALLPRNYETQSNNDQNDWLLNSVDKNYATYSDHQLSDEITVLGSSSPSMFHEQQNRDFESVIFGDFNKNLFNQNMIFPVNWSDF